jgi:hypothetical protein
LIHHFFDVPIYRCSQAEFDKAYDRDLAAHLLSLWGPGGIRDDGIRRSAEYDFWKNYGGPWPFNQIVAWIRLHLLGTQVRGELWKTDAKVLVRRPKHKRFVSPGADAFEIDCRAMSSKNIYQAIIVELKALVAARFGNRAHLDVEAFSNIGPHVNWKALCAAE